MEFFTTSPSSFAEHSEKSEILRRESTFDFVLAMPSSVLPSEVIKYQWSYLGFAWFATASVSYAHLSTKAELNVIGNTQLLSPNSPRDSILKGESKIEINPIVTYLGIGYRF